MEKRNFVLYLFLIVAVSCQAQIRTPRQEYGELFRAVQMLPVFPDQKTFLDCIPRSSPEDIVRLYKTEKEQPGFDLSRFVSTHFSQQQDSIPVYNSNIRGGIRLHIAELWKDLTRNADSIQPDYSSLLPLPYPYVLPGGRFKEIYYWDSYFILLGLEENKDTAMIENMVQNISWLIRTYGFVPNGNRSYYLTRSQPPFFSLMVELLAHLKGNEVYQTYLPSLLQEYGFWMQGADSIQPGQEVRNVVDIDGAILNRYWDESTEPREESFKEDLTALTEAMQPRKRFFRNIRAAAESGWDFSGRWFADGTHLSTINTTDIVPLDLNCLLYNLEQVIATAYEVNGDPAMRDTFRLKARQRKQAILKYCWNDTTGYL